MLSVVLLVTSACKKNQVEVLSRQDAVNGKAIDQVLSAKTVGEQKVLYNLLNGAEKSKIWKSHLLEVVGDLETNQEQVQFINMQISKLTPELFSIGSEDNIKFKITESLIKSEMIRLFGKDKAFNLIADLSPSKKVKNSTGNKNTTPTFPPGTGGCDCSKVSDWCGDANPYGCVREGCTSSDSGCGTFWSYSCNGDCF